MRKSLPLVLLLLTVPALAADEHPKPPELKRVEADLRKAHLEAQKIEIKARETAVTNLKAAQKAAMAKSDLDGAVLCKNRIEELEKEIKEMKDEQAEPAVEKKPAFAGPATYAGGGHTLLVSKTEVVMDGQLHCPLVGRVFTCQTPGGWSRTILEIDREHMKTRLDWKGHPEDGQISDWTIESKK